MKNLMSRRSWLQILGASTVGGLLGGMTSPAAARGRCPSLPRRLEDIVPVQADSPDLVLHKLMLGNARHVNDTPIPHDLITDEALENRFGITPATGQRPAVMILSCADSRVVPELIFDQPRASLFVCRVAGNYATNEAIGSLEYCSRVLRPGDFLNPDPTGEQTRVLIVLGHSNCGAVNSTLSLFIDHATFPPDVLASKIATIVTALRPSVQRAVDQNPTLIGDARLRVATDQVARDNAALLAARTPILAPPVQNGSLHVVPAYYDIASGLVTLL